MTREVVTLVEGPPRSGKTFTRCGVYLTQDLLPQQTAISLSNFPIFKPSRDNPNVDYADVIADYVALKSGKTFEEIRDRIRQIPADVETSWRTDISQGGSGPWEYLEQHDLQDVHISIDEGHTVCGKHQSKKHRDAWMKFLAELGHRRCTLEFITQDVSQMSREINALCAKLITIVPGKRRRDPLFQIEMEDWYEMYAGFVRGKWLEWVYEFDHNRYHGGWKVERSRSYAMSEDVYRFFDSFDDPKNGGAGATEPPKHEFEKRTKLELLRWFVQRNTWEVSTRGVAGGVVCWLFFGGGFEGLTQAVLGVERPARQEAAAPKETPLVARNVLVESTVDPAHLPRLDEPRRVGRSAVMAEVWSSGEWLRPGEAWRTVAALTRETAVTVDGAVFKVGELIGRASYEDETTRGDLLEEIDFDRHRFRVDGVWRSLVEAAGERAADPVSGALRSGGGVLGAEPLRGPWQSRPESGGDAFSGFRADDGEGIREVGRVGSVARRGTRDVVATGGDAERRAFGSGEAGRGRDGRDGNRVLHRGVETGGLRGGGVPLSSSHR